ncbi:hypothetical protein C5167_016465 [Papaver somniferum]|nr:hypothetical protein C5167_016465 [Papaver somniferum]
MNNEDFISAQTNCEFMFDWIVLDWGMCCCFVAVSASTTTLCCLLKKVDFSKPQNGREAREYIEELLGCHRRLGTRQPGQAFVDVVETQMFFDY